MSIVTIIGASGTAIQVSVSSEKAKALTEAYAQQVSDAYSKNRLTTVLLSTQSSIVTAENQSLLEGFATTGGSFAPLGSYDFIGVGPLTESKESAALSLLNEAVTINGAGVTSNGILSVLGGSTIGLTYEAGRSNGDFLGVSGNNFFNGGAQSANWTIVTESGNDTILATNGVNSIEAGTGNNLIQLQQGTNNVVSDGQDTITGQEGGKTWLTVLGGNSLVTLASDSFVYDNATIGSHITLGTNSTVQAGQSSTIIFTGANGTITGAHNDTVSALGDLEMRQGSDQTLSVSGALRFISGTGATEIAAEHATLWGANDLSATVNVTKSGLWTGNQAGESTNELINASSSQGLFEAWTGAGKQTVIGGQSADHFVFGTQYEGNDGASYATITGGSGAANSFGVLAGHTAGDITITDFTAVEGNKFFMYNYKPADAEAAVQNLLATATIQGGNTSIMLDNDMKVTFLGVTDLKSHSIDIS